MTSELTAGDVFAERYRIERRLAAGGMGAVYEVVHLETNRRRALKVLHNKFLENDSLRSRFRQEARVAAEIESEYIVDVFDAGIDTTTGMPFLVMELLRGEDVRKRVRRDGPLPAEDALRFLYETSLALEKTHQANIVHRDLKPDNLFLCEREHGPPRIKVLDFGIAKIVADGTIQTQVTQSLGTPMYMAPEQFSMGSTVSPATDIYALGLIAYTMLAGKPYWTLESKKARSPIAFALHAAKGPAESPKARAARLGVELPEAFDAWFFRATAEEPTERFPSALAAVAELAEVLGVPLPHESSRGKAILEQRSIPPPSMERRSIPPTLMERRSIPPAAMESAPQPPSESASAASDGPISMTLHGAGTSAGDVLDAISQKIRKQPLLAAACVLATFMAGSLVNVLLPARSPRDPSDASTMGVDASSANAAAERIAPSAEPTPTIASAPAASASAAPIEPESTIKTPAASTTSSAAPADPAPTKKKTVRPSIPVKQPSDGVIWNND
ncbi:MAG: protein kinase [Polyangiaceae bacterium]|nr:protein kinase [Polyangiaceae bacterium]